jgi:hypothetical protein
MTNTNLLIQLPSGGRAVYTVQPQHLPREDVPDSRLWPMMYGEQVAHEKDGVWYRPSGWVPFDDPKLAAMFERCPEPVLRGVL